MRNDENALNPMQAMNAPMTYKHVQVEILVETITKKHPKLHCTIRYMYKLFKLSFQPQYS